MNTDASWPDAEEAEARVLRIQTKLHQWATDDPKRRFADLYNLVCDPAFLAVAWKRVKSNRGARSAGVDGQTAHYVAAVRGEEAFLAELRADLKARTFRSLPVRERMIPKRDGKSRRLGIATVRDRVVQASLKLVLEPIWEADCAPRGAVSPGEVKRLAGRLSQQTARSWGQPGPGGAGLGGSSPRQRSGGDGTARRRRPRKQDGKGQ